MIRKLLLWLGIFLILAGIALPLYVHFVFDYSEREARPIDIAVNTSGRETRAEFTATRQSRYSVAILVPVPRGAAGHAIEQKYFWKRANDAPGCHTTNAKCCEPKYMRVSGTRLNNALQEEAFPDCNSFFGVNERGLFRDLFLFSATPGRRYVITTNVSVDDSVLAKLGPRLVVDRSPPWIAEEEDVASLGASVGLFLAWLIGIPCIIISLRWKRNSKTDPVAKN